MAGDWIKMRGNLWDDPRVAALVDATNTNEALVIGGLYWLWATADQHTEDGCMPGLTTRQIDRKTSIPGFAEALIGIGWLADDPQGVVVTKFEEHNGTSAKRRCVEAQRKAGVRAASASDADIGQTKAGQKAPKCGAREEKRREEKKTGAKAPAPSDDSPVVLEVPLIGDAVHQVRQSRVDFWSGLYTAVDILGELRKMAGWLDSNPTRRKTQAGIEKFITGWLGRAQDQGGSSPTGLRVVGGRSRRDDLNDAFDNAINKHIHPNGDHHDRKRQPPDDDIIDVEPVIR